MTSIETTGAITLCIHQSLLSVRKSINHITSRTDMKSLLFTVEVIAMFHTRV